MIAQGEEDVPMKNPVHPGRIVRHDCPEPLGQSVAAARKDESMIKVRRQFAPQELHVP